jgi:TonB-dependent SusC/RagA subfamily outer membrane receptor
MPRITAPDARTSGLRASARGLAAACLTLATLATLACASSGAAPRATTASAGHPSVRDADSKSLENLFAGRFAGVSVSRAGNGGVQLRIRGGANSFLGGNEPLYVVDGTALPAGTGGIVFLNPYDIEAIEVLKNPADVGIYGIRGANGVVKITTKRPGGRR